MKKHLISLFDKTHLRKTILLFTFSVLLIIASGIVGISDNLPGIAMLLSGIILLFFSVLHPWENSMNYGILAVVCVGILLLEWLGIHILARMNKTQYISEGIAMGVAFFICVPGILVGIIGVIICSVRKK